MLSAEKIQSNWERYLNEIKTNISKERSDIVIPFLEKVYDNMDSADEIINDVMRYAASSTKASSQHVKFY